MTPTELFEKTFKPEDKNFTRANVIKFTEIYLRLTAVKPVALTNERIDQESKLGDSFNFRNGFEYGMKRYREIITGSKEEVKETGWISVEDRMPEKRHNGTFSGMHLTINQYGLQRIEQYHFEFKRWTTSNQNHGEEVTDWQPLPEPPIKQHC